WQGSRLVAGLYGLYQGRVFFGESMFTTVSDASKVAFAHAVAFLEARGCALIDCQVWSGHLHRLGAELMPRATFLACLKHYCEQPGKAGTWTEAFRAWQDRLAEGFNLRASEGLCNNSRRLGSRS